MKNLTAPPALALPDTLSRGMCENGILRQPNKVVRKRPPKSKNTSDSAAITFKYGGSVCF